MLTPERNRVLSEAKLAEIEQHALNDNGEFDTTVIDISEVLALVKMARYADHTQDCQTRCWFIKSEGPWKCDCGFEEAMK